MVKYFLNENIKKDSLCFCAVYSSNITRVLQKVSALYFLKNLYLCYRHENNITFQYNLPLLDTFSPAICKLLNAV